MCRHKMGWQNRLRVNRVNIWDVKRMRPDKLICHQMIHETKFTRPPWLTRFGFPMKARTDNADKSTYHTPKYCNMSRIHKQDNFKPFQR
eukprot:NODE_28849_length_464_cov_4.451039.p2 GENE.NODE_28849_length_464_cov_4.451039~~NODE_28849_length_464_cov_4.451039.p2  ORF type:complete len:89 (-),score=18.78 NODE_28849_length_464_cov_4.451039:105-371(-)